MTGTYASHKSKLRQLGDKILILKEGLKKETLGLELNDKHINYAREIEETIDEYKANNRNHLLEHDNIQIDDIGNMFSQCFKIMSLTLEVRRAGPFREAQHIDECLSRAVSSMTKELLMPKEDCSLRLSSCWISTHSICLEMLQYFLSIYINKEGELYKELLDEGTLGLYHGRDCKSSKYLNIPKFRILINANLKVLFDLCHGIVDSAYSHEERKNAAVTLAKKSLERIHQSWKEFAMGQLDHGMSSVRKTLEEKLIHMREQDALLASQEIYAITLSMLADMYDCAKSSLDMKCIRNLTTWDAYNPRLEAAITQLCSWPSTASSASASEIERKIIEAHMHLMYGDFEDMIERPALTELRVLCVPDIHIDSRCGVIGGDTLKFLVVRHLYVEIANASAAKIQDKAGNTEKIVGLSKWLQILSSIAYNSHSVTEDESELIELVKMVIENYKTSILARIPGMYVTESSSTTSNEATAGINIDVSAFGPAPSEIRSRHNSAIYRQDEGQPSTEMAMRPANDRPISFALARLGQLSEELIRLTQRVSQGELRDDEVSSIVFHTISNLFPNNAQEERALNH